MENIIQQNSDLWEKLFKGVLEDFLEHPDMMFEFVSGIKKGVLNCGCQMIAETFTMIDNKIRESKERKEKWHVVRRDTVSRFTTIGLVTFQKTLYKSKTTNERCYLLDKVLGMHSHERMTEDAVAAILDEAVESSYEKSGKKASMSEQVITKQTVKNIVHELEFPNVEVKTEPKQVECLYIDADEDHVALQPSKSNKNKTKRKKKQSKKAMPKLVYAYEGYSKKNKKNTLCNPTYFGGMYDGTEKIEDFWEKIYEHIAGNYDERFLKVIYINGDGARWIKSGAKYLPKAKFVLDKFHMHKYIIQATSHLKENLEDARDTIYDAIYTKDKDKLEYTFNVILELSSKEDYGKVLQSKNYLLNNWSGILNQTCENDQQIHCCAEGHISHIYSERLSSRPLAWCKTGVDKMAQLRVYKANGGKMIDLVRYQKKEKAVGCETFGFSAAEIEKDLNLQRGRLGALYGTKFYSIPENIKKAVGIKYKWNL